MVSETCGGNSFRYFCYTVFYDSIHSSGLSYPVHYRTTKESTKKSQYDLYKNQSVFVTHQS